MVDRGGDKAQVSARTECEEVVCQKHATIKIFGSFTRSSLDLASHPLPHLHLS